MNDDERRRAAQALREIPFFNELWNEFEQAAINACLNAKYDDHEARQAHAAEARIIRRFRSRLEAIANEGQSTLSRKAPA